MATSRRTDGARKRGRAGASRRDGPPAPPPLTKSDYAYNQLRRRILDGELPPDTRLMLRPLADELGLSVMPIRDALRMLERDGLVRSESHRGTTVTPISAPIVVETISIRMWLEVLAVREAAERHTDETLAAVEDAMFAANRQLKSTDGLAYAQANRALHEAFEAPASQSVRELIAETWDRLWQARRRMSLFSLVPDRRRLAQEEHEAIFAALGRRDADAAADAMSAHRASTIEAWRRALSDVDAGGGQAASDASTRRRGRTKTGRRAG